MEPADFFRRQPLGSACVDEFLLLPFGTNNTHYLGFTSTPTPSLEASER